MVNCNCEHNWKVWPETDGREQKCIVCGAYRPTPAEELPATLQPENTKLQSFNSGVQDCVDTIDTIIAYMQDTSDAQEGFAKHITLAKIAFAERIKEVCQHRILPRTPGETRLQFISRLKDMG